MSFESISPRMPPTSPRRGEVDLLLAMRSIVQCKSGEGATFEIVLPHPTPPPSNSDLSDFDQFQMRNRGDPRLRGEGARFRCRSSSTLSHHALRVWLQVVSVNSGASALSG